MFPHSGTILCFLSPSLLLQLATLQHHCSGKWFRLCDAYCGVALMGCQAMEVQLSWPLFLVRFGDVSGLSPSRLLVLWSRWRWRGLVLLCENLE